MIRRVVASSVSSTENLVGGWLAEVVTWLSVGLGAFLVLLVCSELALAEVRTPTLRDTRSRTRADYSPWSNSVVHRVEAQILQAILQDRGLLPEGAQGPAMIALAPGELWGGEMASGLSPVTPSPSPISGSSASGSTGIAPPLLTPSFAATAPLIPPAVPSPTSPPPATAQAPPTATISVAPSATSMAPKRSWERPDTSTSPGEGTDYFLCDLTGSDTGILCVGGARGNGHSSTEMTSYDFYSDPLSGGTITGSFSAHIYLYAANVLGVPAPIGIMVYAGSSSWWPLGGYTLFVPGDTAAPTLLDRAFAILPYDVAPGDMIRLEITGGPGATFYWDGEFGDSRITIP